VSRFVALFPIIATCGVAEAKNKNEKNSFLRPTRISISSKNCAKKVDVTWQAAGHHHWEG
jgi:hypothetical protein